MVKSVCKGVFEKIFAFFEKIFVDEKTTESGLDSVVLLL